MDALSVEKPLNIGGLCVKFVISFPPSVSCLGLCQANET